MSIDPGRIEQIDEETINRYNNRLNHYGIAPKTLGWGSKEDQITRFSAAIQYVDFSNRSVLDIGCGFSDFYDFLLNNGVEIKEYKGIDINEKFINISRKKYPENSYEVRNILLDNYDREQADIATMFGLLNFKLQRIGNMDYAKKMIIEASKIVRHTLIVDFLSSHLTEDYPKEDFVYYYDPKDILNTGLELSNNVVLVHDYPPIPQKEFMLILRK